MKAVLKPSVPAWMSILMPKLVPILILLALTCTLTPARAQSVTAFEPETLQTIEQSRKDKPFWLILWGLDCVYCVKSMQNLAALQKTHPTLNVVTIAVDPIDESEALQQRLQSIGLKSTDYAFGNASSQALRHAIDPNWRGEKPRAYYYAPGQARRVLVGVLDAARVLGQ